MPNRILRALLLLLTFLLPGMSAGWLAPARASNEPLDPNQAFRFEARQIDRHTLEARWRIAEGYYLYRDKFRFEIEPATLQPGTPQLPAGQTHDDDNFGKVDIYRDTVSIRLPIEFLDKPAGTTTPAPPTALTLRVRSQGCADLGVCYPPLSQQITLSWQPAPSPTTAAPGNIASPPRPQPVSPPPLDEPVAERTRSCRSPGRHTHAPGHGQHNPILRTCCCPFPFCAGIDGRNLAHRPPVA